MSADALPTTPDTPAGRYAVLLLRLTGSGQWERALEVARDWLSEDPASAQAHLTAGQALIHLGQYPEARKHLRKALEGNPGNSFAHRLQSIACYHLKDFRQADEHIHQAISLTPGDATHWYHLAWMRYQSGAPAAAAKHARRSLELSPNNANTLNLLALCEGKRGPAQLAQYLHALELDPENESIHNNIGTYYLDVDGNLPAAEACFRRALSLDPANKTAQKNLFVVLRRRDPLYRALQFPRTMVDRLRWGRNGQGTLPRLALVGLWLMAGKIFVIILVLWLLFVYPLVKIYEYLTLGDLRAKAGVPGARRGGLFGFRRWPFGVRFGIFAVMGTAFWSGVIYLVHDEITQETVTILAGLAVVGFLVMFIWRALRRAYRNNANRRAEKWLQQRMNAPRS